MIPAKQARIRFGEILGEAFYQDKRFLVTKKNKPMVIIVGMCDWERLNKKALSKKKPRFRAYNLGRIEIPLTRDKMYE